MNMNKYDKMVEINKERSDEKVTAARLAIRKLMENGEQISVPQLMKMTGLSRGFFLQEPDYTSRNRPSRQSGRNGQSSKTYTG